MFSFKLLANLLTVMFHTQSFFQQKKIDRKKKKRKLIELLQVIRLLN